MKTNLRVVEVYTLLGYKSIIDIIKEKLLSDFLGKKNAKNRKIMLRYCRYFDRAITDRKMRMIYNAILPMGWCEKGIFVVDDLEEVNKAIRTRRRTVDAHETAIKKLEIHKTFLEKRKKLHERKKESEVEQMRLF